MIVLTQSFADSLVRADNDNLWPAGIVCLRLTNVRPGESIGQINRAFEEAYPSIDYVFNARFTLVGNTWEIVGDGYYEKRRTAS